MYDISLFYKSLRYLAQTAIIYLILRYFPYSNMTSIQSLMISIIILLISLILENLCLFNIGCNNNSLIEDEEEIVNNVEKIKKEESCNNCNTCQMPEKSEVEKFEKEKKNNKRCRMVCDSDSVESNKKETFDEANKSDSDSKESKNGYETQVSNDKKYTGTQHGGLGYDQRYGFGGMFYDEHPFYNRFRNQDLQYLKNTGEFYSGKEEQEEAIAKKEKAKRSYIKRDLETEFNARTTDGYYGRYQETGEKSQKIKTVENQRVIKGELDDEIPYSDYNHLPIASGYKSHDYEYGYSFIPPEKWYPQPPRPPICVSEKRAPVCPVYTNGAPVDVKEFHSTRRITPPDIINADYVNDKLNGGR